MVSPLAKPWRKRQSCEGPAPSTPLTQRATMEQKGAKSKGGRPALGEDKREKVVRVYLSAAEHQQATRKAAAIKKSLPEYGRAVILNGHVKAIDTPQAQEEKRKLIGLSNNVNQLARQAHLQGMKQIVAQLDAMIQEINEIIKKYNR